MQIDESKLIETVHKYEHWTQMDSELFPFISCNTRLCMQKCMHYVMNICLLLLREYFRSIFYLSFFSCIKTQCKINTRLLIAHAKWKWRECPLRAMNREWENKHSDSTQNARNALLFLVDISIGICLNEGGEWQKIYTGIKKILTSISQAMKRFQMFTDNENLKECVCWNVCEWMNMNMYRSAWFFYLISA